MFPNRDDAKCGNMYGVPYPPSLELAGWASQETLVGTI